MQTAEEFVAQIDFTAGHQAALELIQARERDVRRDAWVDAALESCPYCRERGLPPIIQETHANEYGGRTPCRGLVARRLIAKLDAEAEHEV